MQNPLLSIVKGRDCPRKRTLLDMGSSPKKGGGFLKKLVWREGTTKSPLYRLVWNKRHKRVLNFTKKSSYWVQNWEEVEGKDGIGKLRRLPTYPGRSKERKRQPSSVKLQ